MGKNNFFSKAVLLPLSKLYGMTISMRNNLFDWGVLKQKEFGIPILVVGNITVGGTGKTPHIEYLINILRYNYHIGFLSRGYKRKTQGFIEVTRYSTPLDIGDEPYQIYQKFGSDISMGVCEDRCKGIIEMLRIDNKINLFILDDAFQHRYVKPTVSVLLTDFNHPLFYDHLLPYGRLREPKKSLYRADIVVVTKCPDRVRPAEYRIFKSHLDLFPYQQLFFSRYAYERLVPLFPDEANYVPCLEWLTENDVIIAVSGIANPRLFLKYLKSFKAKVKESLFQDHHNYTRKDIEEIQKKFMDQPQPKANKYIITTEKDAVRIISNPYFPYELKSRIYYLPINVQFVQQDGIFFEQHLRKLLKMNDPGTKE